MGHWELGSASPFGLTFAYHTFRHTDVGETLIKLSPWSSCGHPGRGSERVSVGGPTVVPDTGYKLVPRVAVPEGDQSLSNEDYLLLAPVGKI